MRKIIPYFILASIIGLFQVSLSSLNTAEKQDQYLVSNNKMGYKGSLNYWASRNGNVSLENKLKYVESARKQIAAKPKFKSLGIQFKELGPNNVGGRTRAILVDNENSQLVYAGGVTGGLFYSMDGGATWNKTSPGDEAEALTVNCITQDSDGYVYYGTGEGAFYDNEGNGSKGFLGKGVFKSRDPHGTSFSQIASSWDLFVQQFFYSVNSLATDKNGYLFAAVYGKLYRSKDKGDTWESLFTSISTSQFTNVKICDDYYLVVEKNKVYKSTTGDKNTFYSLSGSGTGQLPSSGVGRIELAIAPSNSNYVYASMVTTDGNLFGIYRSKDAGSSWDLIGNGGSTTFNPFNISGAGYGQGDYDNCIMVDPSNENKIFVGGVTMYMWEDGANWQKITNDWPDPNDEFYVHPDKHTFAIDPKNPLIFYLGTDGGIYKTVDGGIKWKPNNKQFNITQFYDVAFGSDGVVLGGTQDNSNQYIDFKGNTVQSADVHNSGDGGYAAISQFIPDAFFVESQNGNIKRSLSRGPSYTGFFNHNSLSEGVNTPNFASFVAPFILWEKDNDALIKDSTSFIADKNYVNGDVVTINSKISGVVFYHTLTAGLSSGDTLVVKDPKQSMFVMATNYGVYITREALNFSKTPSWVQLTSSQDAIISLEVSEDGNHIYYGTWKPPFTNYPSSHVTRISNVSEVFTDADVSKTTQTKIGIFSGAVTDIAVNPNNGDSLVVALGTYGESSSRVKLSTTASTTTGTTSFTDINGDLPVMPVYSALIEKFTGNVLIGTEYGIFSTVDGGTTWDQETDGFPNVPTLTINQQIFPGTENLGQIYVATHGRGIFTSEHYKVVGVKEPIKLIEREEVKLYPNPSTHGNVSIEFDAPSQGEFLLELIDLKGSVVQTKILNLYKGKNINTINVSQLSSGSYSVLIKKASLLLGTSKLIISK